MHNKCKLFTADLTICNYDALVYSKWQHYHFQFIWKPNIEEKGASPKKVSARRVIYTQMYCQRKGFDNDLSLRPLTTTIVIKIQF